jgi:hypothetical protein
MLRLIGDAVYGVLDANSDMGDGVPLFDEFHNNIYTAKTADTAPTVELLGEVLYK